MRIHVALVLLVAACGRFAPAPAPAPDPYAAEKALLEPLGARCMARLDEDPPVRTWRDHADYSALRDEVVRLAAVDDPKLRLEVLGAAGTCRDYLVLWKLVEPRTQDHTASALRAACLADVTYDEAACWSQLFLRSACCEKDGCNLDMGGCAEFCPWGCNAGAQTEDPDPP